MNHAVQMNKILVIGVQIQSFHKMLWTTWLNHRINLKVITRISIRLKSKKSFCLRKTNHLKWTQKLCFHPNLKLKKLVKPNLIEIEKSSSKHCSIKNECSRMRIKWNFKILKKWMTIFLTILEMKKTMLLSWLTVTIQIAIKNAEQAPEAPNIFHHKKNKSSQSIVLQNNLK